VLRSGECDRQSLVVRVVLAGLAQRVLLESLAERVAQAPKAEPVLMAVLAESVVLDCLAQELLLRVVVVLPEEPMRHPKLLGLAEQTCCHCHRFVRLLAGLPMADHRHQPVAGLPAVAEPTWP
jgi:hypothetical protein